MSVAEPTGAAGHHVRRATRHVRQLLSFDILNRLARFAAAVMLARTLSIEDFGALNVGIAAAGVLVTATGLGLGEQAARDVAVEPSLAPERAGQILALRLTALGFAASAGIVALAALDGSAIWLGILTAVMALSVAISAEWALRGLERMRQLGATLFAGGAVVLAGAGALALTGGSAVAALAVFAAGEAVASLLSWAFAGREVRPRRLRYSGGGALLRRSWPLGLATLALYGTYANVDTIILAAARGTADAGLYTAPYRAFVTLNLVAVFAAYSFLPMISRAAVSGDDSAFRGLRIGLALMLGYGAIVLGLAEVVGADALGVVFGSRFSEMGPTLITLSIATVWFSVSYPAGYSLIGTERNGLFLLGAGTAALLTLALDLALIPPFGPIGAAAATSGALVAAALIWLRAQRLIDRQFLPVLATMIGLSALAIIALVEPAALTPVGALTLAAGAAWIWAGYRARHSDDATGR